MLIEGWRRTVPVVLLCGLLGFAAACSGGAAPSGRQSSAEQGTEAGPAEAGDSEKQAEEPAPEYPVQPIRIAYTHGTSGSPVGDGGIRLFLSYLEREIDVPIVFENMPGAGGNIAREFAWKSKPDGYTLLASIIPSMSIGKIATGGEFEPLEFEHVYGIIGNNFDGLAVPGDSPYQTLDEFIAAAKADPGTLSIAGLGIGTNSHLETLQFEEALGTTFRFVPFDGANATVAAVAGKQTDAGIANIGNFQAFGQPGQIRILAALAEERDKRAPDVPSIEELGIQGVGLPSYTGFFAPPGTPDYALDYLIEAMDRAAKGSDYAEKQAELGAQAYFLPGKEFLEVNTRLHQNVERFADALKEQ